LRGYKSLDTATIIGEALDQKALSPVVASIILIALTVGIAVIIAVWFGAMTIGFEEPKPITCNITPNIFSTSNNVAILNEDAIFDVHIQNKHDSPKNVTIDVDSQEEKVESKEIEVDANSEQTITVNEKLTVPGYWIISVSSDKDVLSTYSFVTMTSRVDALMQINALNALQESQESAAQADIIAMLSLLVSSTISGAALVISLFRSKKG
jgi:FlaG/FlaF family flagellin (archaellin)